MTLTAMFMLRGLCFVISLDSVPIKHPFVDAFSEFQIGLPGDGWISGPALLMLAALVVVASVVWAQASRRVAPIPTEMD